MPTSILIIDDSENVREQIGTTLQSVAIFDHIHKAKDGVEAFKLLLGTHIDLILCDLEMPRIDGIKLLKMIGSREELRDIPVIMLTGHEGRDLKIKLLSEGACDYVTKPFDPGELVARVKIQLKIKMLQDELKASNEKLTLLSITDPLTQLFNRRYMMEMLGKELERAERMGSHLSFFMVDIDRFKNVNDLYGHQNGDQVLIAVANYFRNDLRSYDVAARYGGEEFVLILPGTRLEVAMVVAERFREKIQTHSFSGSLKGLKTTVSIGVATYPATFISSAEELIREADEALYRAKAGGRNHVVSMLQK